MNMQGEKRSFRRQAHSSISLQIAMVDLKVNTLRLTWLDCSTCAAARTHSATPLTFNQVHNCHTVVPRGAVQPYPACMHARAPTLVESVRTATGELSRRIFAALPSMAMSQQCRAFESCSSAAPAEGRNLTLVTYNLLAQKYIDAG